MNYDNDDGLYDEVTDTLVSLAEKGLVEQLSNGKWFLTELGQKVATQHIEKETARIARARFN